MTETPSFTKKLYFRLETDLWRRFKALAVLSGQPVGDRLVDLVRRDVAASESQQRDAPPS